MQCTTDNVAGKVRYSVNIYIRLFVIFLFTYALTNNINSQEREETNVFFLLGSASLNNSKADNLQTLDEFVKSVQKYQSDSLISIEKIHIRSCASPEGEIKYNKLLAQKRSNTTVNYIKSRLNLPDSILTIENVGVAWDMLRVMVEESELDKKAEILSILDSVPAETWKRVKPMDRWLTLVDSRNKHLMDLHYGRPYKQMVKEFFPIMRTSEMIIVHFKQKISRIEVPLTLPVAEINRDEFLNPQHRNDAQLTDIFSPEDTVAYTPQTESVIPETTIENTPQISATIPEKTAPQIPQAEMSDAEDTIANAFQTEPVNYVKKPLFALKTNLLFDVLTMLNVELEVPIGKRWSVAAEWIFPWWTNCHDNANPISRRNTLQMLNGNIEGRYWFGNRTEKALLTGLFAGVYVGGGLYDLQYKSKGYQGEFFVAAGLSAGYAHTIGLDGNLRMEYALGVGYVRTNYKYYEDHFGINQEWHSVRKHSGIQTWFGPTRAKVSLVYLLNYKKKEK